jgi:multiple sugar transport system permease protein
MTADMKSKGQTKHRIPSYQKKEWFWGYVMIAPVTLGLGIFYIYPFFVTFYNSFLKIGSFNVSSWGGLINYRRLLSDASMWNTLKNTVRYVVFTIPATLFLALLVAVLLNVKIKGKGFYRVLYFLPYVTMAAAISMVWKWMFNGDYGLINYILGFFGIEGRRWLTDTATAPYAIIVVSIWSGIGYNMIILLAGIQGISSTYYEAARIDGANAVDMFFRITLPLVTPTLFFLLVTDLISSFQIFDTIYMMIGKNTVVLENTQSIVMYFYRNAFDLNQKGYASAVAMLLFVLIMIVTVIQMALQKKWVNYD